jgi:hypothetical protein
MSVEIEYEAVTGSATARLSLVDAARDGDRILLRVVVQWRRSWRQNFDAVTDLSGGLLALSSVPVEPDEEPVDHTHDTAARLVAPFLRETFVHARLAALVAG